MVVNFEQGFIEKLEIRSWKLKKVKAWVQTKLWWIRSAKLKDDKDNLKVQNKKEKIFYDFRQIEPVILMIY